MLRVVLGRARPDREWSRTISDLQFNSAPGVQENTRARGATSTILTVSRSHRGEVEADLETNGEPLDGREGIDGVNEGKARV
jgi:hypothetical protein